MEINWTVVIVAAITAIPSSISAFVAYRSLQRSQENGKGIQNLEVSVNGKMERLLEARVDAADAKGQLKERDAERVHLAEGA